MKNIILLASFLIYCCLATFCYAASLAYVTKAERLTNATELTGAIEYWEEEDRPNPCYGNSKYDCIYALEPILNYGTDKAYGFGIITGNFYASDIPTMKEVVIEFKKKFPMPYHFQSTFNHSVIPTIKNVCVGMVWSDNYLSAYTKPLPNINCPTIPPFDLECSVTGNYIIDHGFISSSDLSHVTASTALAIKCNQDATLNVFTAGQGNRDITLNQEDTLRSRLKINGQDASDGVKVTVAKDINTSLIVSSEVFKTGEVIAGPFHGAGTIILSYE